MEQPSSLLVQRIGAGGRFAAPLPGVEQIAAQPECGRHLLDAKLRQGGAPALAGRQRQLMPYQVIELQVQPVMAAGAEPMAGVVPIAGRRSQIELDGELQVMDAFVVAYQQVELAERLPREPDRQIRGEQLDAGCLAESELPEPLVIEPQAADRPLRQPGIQG